MTDLDPSSPSRAYVPPGHPVRWFVLAIGIVAAVLGAVWWSGGGRADLSVEILEVSPDQARLGITNESRSSIELRALHFDDPRLDDEAVDRPPGRLAAGQSVVVVVRYRSACAPTPPGGYWIPLGVTGRTQLGLVRHVDAGDVSGIADLACSVDG